MAGKLPSGKSNSPRGGNGMPRSKYQGIAKKGGSVGHMGGSKGRSSYQSLGSSPKGKNAFT